MDGSLRRQLAALGAVLFLSGAGFLASACQRMRDGDVLVENVWVFDPVSGTFAEPADVLIRGDRIEAVGQLGSPGTGVTRLDAAGKYALPGLWDSHVHFSFLHVVGGDSAVVGTLEGFVRNGVTAVRDVGGPLDTIAALSRRVESGDIVGPRIYFAGPLLAGPPLLEHVKEGNRILPGLAVEVASRAGLDSILDRLGARGATMTKAIDRWDPALFRYYLEGARARSLQVVLDPGAPILNPIPIDTALALGVPSIEHAQAAWRGVLRDDLRREVEAFMAAAGTDYTGGNELLMRIMALGEASVSRDRLRALAEVWARSGTYFSPTLRHAVSTLAENPPEQARQPFEGRVAAQQLFVRELSARGVRLLVGQDNFLPDGTHEEMELLAAAGVTPLEVLRAATLYPVRFLGLEDSAGTIFPGKRADLVILDANPLERIRNIRSVWRVVHRGKVVPDR